jgi:hypothetical protein
MVNTEFATYTVVPSSVAIFPSSRIDSRVWEQVFASQVLPGLLLSDDEYFNRQFLVYLIIFKDVNRKLQKNGN